jgi:predicted DNA-binding transcriptional regulator YafY
MKTKDEALATMLARAAIQATARAMHTAQIAADAAAKLGDVRRKARSMETLRDSLLDAYRTVASSDVPRVGNITIDSDELLDLLALAVRGEEKNNTNTNTSKEH